MCKYTINQLQRVYSVMFLNMMLSKCCSCFIYLFPYSSKMLFYCAPVFFFNVTQPILLSMLFISGAFPSSRLFFYKILLQESGGKDLQHYKDYRVLKWFECNNFSRQKYKVVNLQRKNKIVEMNKKQVGNSAVSYDSIVMVLALIF